jgi:hypothetical protein
MTKSIGQLLADDQDMSAQRARAQAAARYVEGLAAAESDPEWPPEPRRYLVRLAMTAFREAVVMAASAEEAVRIAVAQANGDRIKPGLLFHTTYHLYAVRLHRWGKFMNTKSEGLTRSAIFLFAYHDHLPNV